MVVGTQQPVPEVEVETEVCAVGFVMLRVMRRSIQQKSEGRAKEPARKEFVAAVTKDVEGDLPEHEDREGQGMNRQREENQGSNAGLNKRLRNAKGVGGPR